MLSEIKEKFSKPYNIEKTIEAISIVLLAPLLLPVMAFQYVYFAALEKHEWNWRHSRAIATLSKDSGAISLPSWHGYSAFLQGLLWGVIFFIIDLAPYVAISTVLK